MSRKNGCKATATIKQDVDDLQVNPNHHHSHDPETIEARELHRLKCDLKNAAETETTKTLREIFDEKTRNLAQGRMLTFRDVESVMRKRKANSDLSSDEAEPSVEDDDWDSGASAPPLPLEQAASAASAPSTIQVNSFGLDFAFISTHYCNIFHYKM